MHFGQIGKRYDLVLRLVNQYHFTSAYGYIESDNYIYTFVDESGNVFVWKTTKFMGMDVEDEKGNWHFESVDLNDTTVVKATVKDHSAYKGTEQTVLTRVSVVSIDHAPTKAEIDAQKREEQLASLGDGDFVWRMPYKQFKEHYADCETVAGSFENEHDRATIQVIIRRGRLVPSGVRGKHFRGFEFVVDGKTCCFRAVSEENAEKTCRKMFPYAKSVECVKIYH